MVMVIVMQPMRITRQQWHSYHLALYFVRRPPLLSISQTLTAIVVAWRPPSLAMSLGLEDHADDPIHHCPSSSRHLPTTSARPLMPPCRSKIAAMVGREGSASSGKPRTLSLISNIDYCCRYHKIFTRGSKYPVTQKAMGDKSSGVSIHLVDYISI